MAHRTTEYGAVWRNTPDHLKLIQQHLGASDKYNLAPEQASFAFTDLTNGHTQIAAINALQTGLHLDRGQTI